jgi:hypothetical protein
MVAGLRVFSSIAQIEGLLALMSMTWADVGFDPMLFYLQMIITIVLGLLGLIGAILAFVGKKIGVYMMLIFGIVATVGMFVPIGNLSIIIPIPVTLSASLFIVDPILLLLGGIFGLILKQELENRV